jgi:methyl-accepting chemotaxis protein
MAAFRYHLHGYHAKFGRDHRADPQKTALPDIADRARPQRVQLHWRKAMTIEERLARIEHVSAGSDEQRRKDRETDRALWRDTQRQLNEVSTRLNDLTIKVANLGDRIAEIAEESREADQRLAARIEETDKRLGERIETMISAMGGYIREHSPDRPGPAR